jgi:hypothetical protein
MGGPIMVVGKGTFEYDPDQASRLMFYFTPLIFMKYAIWGRHHEYSHLTLRGPPLTLIPLAAVRMNI